MTGPYDAWVGKQQVVADVITPGPASRLAAALDLDATASHHGERLPLLWHWLYFLDAAPARLIASDGHPQRGDFLPPVALPRRMWAGSQLRFHAPLRVGDGALRESSIVSIRHKQGRSGELVFVEVDHAIRRDHTLLVEERQTLVYREAATYSQPTGPQESVSEPEWVSTVQPDPVLLFRYSALTFNSHRIHYDRDYARVEEGYPDLVVHGPLTATLLLQHLCGHRDVGAKPLRSFAFRSLAPLFVSSPIALNGRLTSDAVDLWAVDQYGRVAMQATAEFAAKEH